MRAPKLLGNEMAKRGNAAVRRTNIDISGEAVGKTTHNQSPAVLFKMNLIRVLISRIRGRCLPESERTQERKFMADEVLELVEAGRLGLLDLHWQSLGLSKLIFRAPTRLPPRI